MMKVVDLASLASSAHSAVGGDKLREQITAMWPNTEADVLRAVRPENIRGVVHP